MVRATGNFDKTERRAAERRPCDPAKTHCRVTDLLDQLEAEAGLWNASAGGVCVVLEPHFPTGRHVAVEFRPTTAARPLRTFAEVVHTILVPSQREMWLTGCAFQDAPVSDEQIQPYCV